MIDVIEGVISGRSRLITRLHVSRWEPISADVFWLSCSVQVGRQQLAYLHGICTFGFARSSSAITRSPFELSVNWLKIDSRLV